MDHEIHAYNKTSAPSQWGGLEALFLQQIGGSVSSALAISLAERFLRQMTHSRGRAEGRLVPNVSMSRWACTELDLLLELWNLSSIMNLLLLRNAAKSGARFLTFQTSSQDWEEQSCFNNLWNKETKWSHAEVLRYFDAQQLPPKFSKADGRSCCITTIHSEAQWKWISRACIMMPCRSFQQLLQAHAQIQLYHNVSG